MGKIFNLDSPLMVFLERAANLIILNFLWLICCIPIVTIVPATSALYYVTLKIARGHDPYIVKPFFHSLKQNLKQGIVFTILYLFLGAFLIVDLNICRSMETSFGFILSILLVVLLIHFLVVVVYTNPLLAQFDNTILNTMKNAFFISYLHPLRTLIVLILHLIPVLIFLLDPYIFLALLPFWIFIGVSLTARFCSNLFVKSFARFMPEEMVEEIEEEIEDESL